MGIAGISRRSAVILAVSLLPIEAVAFLGFSSVPLDVGYSNGTSAWWIAYGVAGLYIHYPVLVAMMYWHIDSWPRDLLSFASFVVGYADLSILALALAFSYRLAKRLISSV
jgi:hypothetical protein